MINHRVKKYIEDHSFCSEYLFKDWEAFLDFIYEEGCRVSSILWWDHCRKIMNHVSCGSGGYTDPDDQEWMYAETWLYEDGFEERSLEDIISFPESRYENNPVFSPQIVQTLFAKQSHNILLCQSVADAMITMKRLRVLS